MHLRVEAAHRLVRGGRIHQANLLAGPVCRVSTVSAKAIAGGWFDLTGKLGHRHDEASESALGPFFLVSSKVCEVFGQRE